MQKLLTYLASIKVKRNIPLSKQMGKPRAKVPRQAAIKI